MRTEQAPGLCWGGSDHDIKGGAQARESLVLMKELDDKSAFKTPSSCAT